MSGETAVARRITSLDQDDAVKRCLQVMFMHEIETADQLVPSYKANYERAIARFAPAWDPDSASSEEAAG